MYVWTKMCLGNLGGNFFSSEILHVTSSLQIAPEPTKTPTPTNSSTGPESLKNFWLKVKSLSATPPPNDESVESQRLKFFEISASWIWLGKNPYGFVGLR